MPKEFLLTAPRELTFREYEENPLGPNEVRARAVVSGISHGTELNLYRGSAPFAEKRFDPDLRLFVKNTDGGGWRAGGLGYEWVGRVTEVGAEVDNFKPGDLVHLPRNHRETQTFAADWQAELGTVKPLPAGFAPEDAAVIAIAGVAAQVIHDARIKLGDRVAVFGLGAIGLIVMQLARLNGAGWVGASDPIASRRALAEEFGADATFDPSTEDVAYAIKSADLARGAVEPGADISIEISGNYHALHDALRTARKAGTVVAGGYYQGGGAPLKLGEEWHHNRLTLISSMGVWKCPHRDYPGWNRGRVTDTVVDLLRAGTLCTDGLITHRIPFTEAGEAYELIDAHPDQVVKVILTYD